MTAAWGIFLRELGRLLAGSGTVVALPVGLAWLAWHHVFGGDLGAMDTLDGTFRAIALVLVPLAVWQSAPALVQERVKETATLWAISPVRPLAVVVGKSAAILTYLGAVAILLLVPLLLYSMPLDTWPWLRLGCGLLGLLLLAGLATSVTLLASALVEHFSTAFAVGLLLLAGWVWGVDMLLRAVATAASLMPVGWRDGVVELFASLAGWDAQSVVLPLFLGWLEAGATTALVGAVSVLLLLTHQVVASESWRG